MLQSLDVISVNLWHMLISLANLIILFFVLKHFLFRPVQAAFDKRQADLEHRYAAADEAREQARQNRDRWEKRLTQAEAQAEEILQGATRRANQEAKALLKDAREQALGMTRQAKNEAARIRKQAAEDIKREIVESSAVLASKLLDREVTPEDHRAMIGNFLKELEDASHEKR